MIAIQASSMAANASNMRASSLMRCQKPAGAFVSAKGVSMLPSRVYRRPAVEVRS